MLTDENEEALRERAALGNLKAVSYYLRSGVNINSSNKMNGWTALHWASHRGHEDVVRTLLANGADAAVVTLKGQTAADLAKTDNVRALFGHRENVVLAEPELPFVAKYLREPDLDKLWSVPGEETGRAATPAAGIKTAFEVAPAGQVVTPGSATGKSKELPVYLSTRSDETLLGSVFAEVDDTIQTTVQRIKEEMDDLPLAFTIAKDNGKLSIPVTLKQHTKLTAQHFRSDDDAIVIVPSKTA